MMPPSQSSSSPKPSFLSSRHKRIVPFLVTVFAWSLVSILQNSRIYTELSSCLGNGNSVAKKSGTGRDENVISTATSTSVHAYSLRTSSKDKVDNNTHHMYTWIGDRWVPPMGVPYLLPQEIRRIFHSENTLWWGDSTARQDYQTMYLLIHSDTATKGHLNKNINKGKRGPTKFHCPARRQPEELFWDLGQVKGTDQNCLANSMAMSNDDDGCHSWSNFALNNQTAGKFDLSMRIECYGSFKSRFENYTELLEREYSILVISAGIWESMRPHICERDIESENGIVDHLFGVLEFLQELSGPSLFVIWKTYGPFAERTVEMVQIDESLVTTTRDWFAEKQPPYMDLADFNWEIEERAYGSDRIKGDLKPHWGLEARLLSIEMISDIVRRKQERENAR